MKLDIAVVDEQNNNVAVVLGNGDGTFLTPWSYMVGRSPWCVISADFNNDNRSDLVVANSDNNTVSVLLGDGNGIFQTPINFTVGNSPQSVISADFNNDKKAVSAIPSGLKM
jgi:DNA-binding beta-propeller fold protein YncE